MHNQISHAQTQSHLSRTNFRKILKKWDKRAKASTKEIYLSRQVEIQPVFNTDVLTHLQDRVASLLRDWEGKWSQVLEEETSFAACPPQVVSYLKMNQPGIFLSSSLN
jgi:hypothetical protein